MYNLPFVSAHLIPSNELRQRSELEGLTHLEYVHLDKFTTRSTILQRTSYFVLQSTTFTMFDLGMTEYGGSPSKHT